LQNKRRRIQETCAECQFFDGAICVCPWSDQYGELRYDFDTCDAWVLNEGDDNEQKDGQEHS
jgi:hypothetical protein